MEQDIRALFAASAAKKPMSAAVNKAEAMKTQVEATAGRDIDRAGSLDQVSGANPPCFVLPLRRRLLAKVCDTISRLNPCSATVGGSGRQGPGAAQGTLCVLCV